MNGRNRRRAGCLLFLLLVVVMPGLLIWRELRQERLSAQLLTAIKDVQAISERNYDPAYDKHNQKLNALKQQAARDEVKTVRLLQEGADPNVCDFAAGRRTFWEEMRFLLKRMFRRSPTSANLSRSSLAIAVQVDDTAIAAALLKAGANDVNAELDTPSGDDRYPLVSFGAYNGNLEIVTSLCAHGADLRRQSVDGTAVLLATLEGTGRYIPPNVQNAGVFPALNHKRRTEIFHLLLANGVRYDPNSKEGYALLSAAAEGDFLELTQELLAAGVLPNAKREWLGYPPEYSPLDDAVINDDIALVKLLLRHGASTRDAGSEPPILYVKSPQMARLLLAHGADLHATQMRGKRQGANAMYFACIDGNTKVVSILIELGFDVNSGGEYSSPIDEAAEYGGFETVRLLLKHGAKVGPHSPGADALFLAIAEQQFDSAKLLLHYGASANSETDPPLTEAAAQDSPEMALELLKRGANVNAGKGSALLAACESCDEDLVAMLLEHGADPTVRLDDGTTAIQAAQQNADPPEDADGIIALLKHYGAKR